MSTLDQIAYYQNRRDEIPNQELAKRLAEAQDKAGTAEIAKNLWNENENVQSDCLKVLYEIGYLDPALIGDYVEDFLKLLDHKNNRLVWGAMIALSTIAELKADQIFGQLDEIKKAMSSGSVITKDNGVKTLAKVASQKDEYRRAIFPYLLEHLASCRPKDVPQHAEKTLPAVDTSNKDAFIALLEKRLSDLSDSQAARVKKVINSAAAR
jgi:hypothetical protein